MLSETRRGCWQHEKSCVSLADFGILARRTGWRDWMSGVLTRSVRHASRVTCRYSIVKTG